MKLSTNQINEKAVTMRRYRSRLKPLTGRPDLTPLINVMFLALIFFMLSSSFVQVSGIRVDLPEVNAASSIDIEKFIVSIAWSEKEPLLYFNDQSVSFDTLAEKLAQLSGISKSATVVIRADNRVPFEVVARVMTLAQKADLASFIAVTPPRYKPDAVFSTQEK
ncbi:MAG: ExbD/TolR family protein [Victivallaceae bacterium]